MDFFYPPSAFREKWHNTKSFLYLNIRNHKQYFRTILILLCWWTKYTKIICFKCSTVSYYFSTSSKRRYKNEDTHDSYRCGINKIIQHKILRVLRVFLFECNYQLKSIQTKIYSGKFKLYGYQNCLIENFSKRGFKCIIKRFIYFSVKKINMN